MYHKNWWNNNKDAEYLDIVTPMYKEPIIECGSNYSQTTGNLEFYSKDETTNFNAYC